MITKTMEATTLKPVTTSRGGRSLAIDDVLEVEADSWAGWWGESLPEWKAPRINFMRTYEVRAKLEPEEIRRVSLSFKSTKARADAWHTRHYGGISEQGLCALAKLLQLFEILRNFFQVLQRAKVALTPKRRRGP